MYAQETSFVKNFNFNFEAQNYFFFLKNERQSQCSLSGLHTLLLPTGLGNPCSGVGGAIAPALAPTTPGGPVRGFSMTFALATIVRIASDSSCATLLKRKNRNSVRGQPLQPYSNLRNQRHKHCQFTVSPPEM